MPANNQNQQIIKLIHIIEAKLDNLIEEVRVNNANNRADIEVLKKKQTPYSTFYMTRLLTERRLSQRADHGAVK